MIDRFEYFSFAISEIYKQWHKLTAEEMERYGLRGTHSVYLLTMAKYPEGLTAAKVCEYCGRDKSDVSRMMSIMEEKGLVTKEGVNRNLYRGSFKLTEKGFEAAEHVKMRANRAVEIAGKDLTEEKRAVFYEALESIVTNLRELSKEGIPE
ncbi:MAG: winged helix DNA-binding protein [Clostridia bacterium]|nr:winged helix DNA-binding protein [Clostridia bacterium]